MSLLCFRHECPTNARDEDAEAFCHSLFQRMARRPLKRAYVGIYSFWLSKARVLTGLHCRMWAVTTVRVAKGLPTPP
jgi:hypothetical protein